jgi:glycine reductase
VVHVCSITPISKTVGANRIVRSVAIPHPFGDPTKTAEQELEIREAILLEALHALETAIEDQTVFT